MYSEELRVHLIDTPGFDDTNKKDGEVLRNIAGWMGETYKQNILLSGLIYLHPITDSRLHRSASRNLSMFKELCGPGCLPGIVLATTMWDLVPPEDGTKREQQLLAIDDFWGEMAKGGSVFVRYLRTKASALAILEFILRNRHHFILQIQNEMVNEKKVFEVTGTGMKVNEDLIEAKQRHRKALDVLREEMRDADASSRQEIAKLMQGQQQEVNNNRDRFRELEASLAELEEKHARDMESITDLVGEHIKIIEALEADIENFRVKLQVIQRKRIK